MNLSPSLALAFLLSFGCCVVATFIVREFARSKGWFDNSLSARKAHGSPVPRVGGIAIAVSFLAPLIGIVFTQNSFRDEFLDQPRLALGLLFGSLIALSIGLVDDMFGSRAVYKLAAQVGLAVFMWWCGYRINAINLLPDVTFELSAISLLVTVLWFLAIINAINLIDGLDGLASGIALFAVLPLLAAASLGGKRLLMLFLLSLVGSLVGFLVFNFHPASIFMGDSGSHFLGLVLAATAIWTSTKGEAALSVMVPLLALGVPLIDTSLVILRRRARGLPLMSADRSHLHHRLMNHGLSHRDAVLVIYVIAACFTGFALIANLATRTAIIGAALLSGALVIFVTHRSRFVQEILGTHMPATRERNRSFHKAVKALSGQMAIPGSLGDIQQLITRVTAELPVRHLELEVEKADGSTDRLPLIAAPAPDQNGYGTEHSWIHPVKDTDGSRLGSLIATLDHESLGNGDDPHSREEAILLLERLCESLERGVARIREQNPDVSREKLTHFVTPPPIDRATVFEETAQQPS